MKIFLALVLLSTEAWACEVNPRTTLASLGTTAPREVIQGLWDGGECEAAILTGLASGKREWLTLAVALRPYTDAWSGESLQNSLGEAMQKAPSRVLPLVGTAGFDARICLPWMMDDSGESDAIYRRVIRKARVMFESFRHTSLKRQALVCLREVHVVEKGPLFRSGATARPNNLFKPKPLRGSA